MNAKTIKLSLRKVGSMSNFILETKGLKKRFGKQIAVKNVSLQVLSGSIYGLLGLNGAGKSTTLKLLAGLIRPDEGEIRIFNQLWQRDHLERMGMLIETPAVYGNLTAVENLRVHTEIMGLPKESIDEVLKIVGLANTGKKLASQFSMGMKQRLGIAIALLGNPELLILDEPTNGLDPLGIQEIRELICSLPEQGITVIISSHLLTEVSQLASHVGIISDGELKYQGQIDHTVNLEDLFMRVVREERK